MSDEQCCDSYTDPWHTRFPRAVSGKCWTKRCSPWPAPFSSRLRRRLLFFVRLVHRYYGAVRLLPSARVCLVALHLRRPASFPSGPRRSRVLPVLVHVVSQRARVLRLRRTNCSLAISRKREVGRGALRAFDRAVCSWPLAVAVDAGLWIREWRFRGVAGHRSARSRSTPRCYETSSRLCRVPPTVDEFDHSPFF